MDKQIVVYSTITQMNLENMASEGIKNIKGQVLYDSIYMKSIGTENRFVVAGGWSENGE